MFLIVGDSWGCGEWSLTGGLAHRGLWQYIEDAGQKAINISTPGSGNLENFDKLRLFFEFGTNDNLQSPLGKSDSDKIIMFQTQWCRDLRHPRAPDLLVDDIFETEQRYISHFYYKLSELAEKYKVKICLVGGCSDTVWLDKFTYEYPGLEIACQSMTNLCINNCHRIQEPNFGGIDAGTVDNILERIGKFKGTTAYYVKSLPEQTLNRIDLWKNYPNWFYPNGTHANRHAHKKLFQYLVDNQILRV
jgi:hypothetical protein